MKLEVKKIDSIQASLNSLKQQIKGFSSDLLNLEHVDYGVTNYLNKIKKLSLQSVDIYTMLERQLFFLKNELKAFNLKEDIKKQQEEKKKQQELRKLKGAKNEI